MNHGTRMINNINLADVRIKNKKIYDAYYNAMSQFGSQYDPMARLTYNTTYSQMDRATIESLYKYDWLTRKIVETIPDDATRKWVDIHTQDEKLVLKLQEKIRSLSAITKIKEAMINARLYGGSICILGIDDNKSPATQLDYKRINDVLYINVIDSNYIYPATYYKDPFKDNYCKPETYKLQPRLRPDDYNGKDDIIHESRILRFDGNYLPEFLRQMNNGWHDSVLNGINQSLKQYGTSMQSGALLFQDFISKVLKMPNLVDLLQSDEGRAALELRLQYAIASFSSLGIVMIGENEEFDKVQTPINGLPDLMDKYVEAVSAASTVPRSRLFGQSLGTLAGATETTRAYYDNITSYQTDRLYEQLQRFFKILLNTKKLTRGREPKEWNFKFCSLWDATDKEVTTARKMQAQVDDIYIKNKTLTPDEVCISRFRPDGYSWDTIVNIKKRIGKFFEENINPFGSVSKNNNNLNNENTNNKNKINEDGFTPPPSGDAPKEVKNILSSTYSYLRSEWVKEHPNDKENKENKAMCATIAWNAVEEAGWYKDRDGKWNKK